MQKHVINAFPTPILVYKNQAHGQMHERLIAECYAARDRDPGEQRSNVKGWHSAPDFFSRTEPGLAHVAAFIRRCLEDAARQFSKGKELTGLKLALNGWININPKHAFNTVHIHPGFLWSGVYYVQAPPSGDRSGQIEFLDPRPGANMVASPIELHTYKINISPDPGIFVLFPSYLPHWVYPNESEEDRISIAINCNYLK